MRDKIRKIIFYNYDSQQLLAEYLGIAYQTLSKKMNGHVDFTRTEIILIKLRYGLTAEEIDDIFLDRNECVRLPEHLIDRES